MLPRVGAFFDDEVGSGQGIGTINAIFAPRLTDLIDAYGNTPEASIRNSTATFIDYASVLREVAIDEHRLNRGRRVENIPNTAQDIGTCVSTGDDDGEFVLTGFGAGNSDRYQRIVTLPVAGRAYLTSISVKASDASDVGNTIVLRIVDVAGGSPGAYTHTLTAEYKRITSPADTSYTGSALQVWVYSSGSASGCTCKDFMLEDITGDISQAPSEVISAATARWFDTTNGNTVAANIVTEAAGDPIHPFTIVDGAKLYTTVKDYATGIVVAAGGSMNDAGKWYTTATGGTTNGATLLTDIGVTDWVEQGIHWRDFGVLAEGSVQNKCTNFNANPDAGLTNLTKGGDVAATMTRVADVAALAAAGLDALCTDGNVIKLDNSGGAADAFVIMTGAVAGSGSDAARSIWVRGGTGSITIGGSANPSAFAASASFVRRESVTTTTATNQSMVIHADAGQVVYFILNQLEESPIVSSEIVTAGSAVTRAEEMGNIKWNDGFFNQAENTTIVDWCPEFASGDLAATLRTILSLNDSTFQFLRQSGTQVNDIQASDDGSAKTTGVVGPWTKDDCIRLIVSASDQANQLILSFRNMSNGDSFTHETAVAYDGAFTSTGFLQLLKAAGGNNSLFRNNVNYNRALTQAEKEVRFG